ncbi:probable LRR receptor-like serine/threonine-protein kinase At3g47570 [Camellia sinensis]|uniref:probable LRR receptor-like serine/threonine-protein kinase At3g47570 n=1 Tax=Camellia sinensis TaxID=4442 RepID=UPI0010369064|nr:probable LRR receptor-like serine/threonine-protein kinase At3g47570 [Camellia sinensis]
MFDGEIPNGGVFKNISAFSIVGNKKLYEGMKVLQLPACPAKDLKERRRPFKRRGIVVVVTLTIFLLIVCTSAIIYRIRRYGLVHQGILKFNKLIIAVKVLKLHECGAIKSFKTECEALKNICHCNLVKVITSCSSIDFKGNDFKALVFEFMKNESLENWLHPICFSEQQDPNHLTFVRRLNIAIDVASAFDYLHHHCEVAIVHSDLTPSNILLDDNLCAHVGDFGLRRILLATTGISNHHQSSSIGIKGTVGYVAPGNCLYLLFIPLH